MTVMTKTGQDRARRIHPGSGRRAAPPVPKGREPHTADQERVQEILGERPRARDLLIEHLHLIQDAEGCLTAGHLQALAGELKISMAEVYEVASFYAHFDIVLDGEAKPAPVTVRVCDSLSCALAGAEALLAGLPNALGEGVRVVRAPCMGRCDTAPVAEVGHRHVDHATLDSLKEVAESGDHKPQIPAYEDLAAYRAGGGYQLLEQCRDGTRSVDDVIAALEQSGLKGKGGAGFPSGLKWKLVRQQPGPRLLAVNADEGEPGTFKDRFYLETAPHRFLEGMLIGAWVAEAEACYIYLRDEYPAAREILLQEIAAIEAAGLVQDTRIELRRGAGAYICGEESAMLESIEGKRGLPRHKPPYPTEVGLFDRPSLINNLETLFWVRDIIERGPSWYADQGVRGRQGFHSFSVSGRVKNPGVKVAPAGVTLQRAGRRSLRRHGRRPHPQGLPAGRRLGRHPAGPPGGPADRLRHPAGARLLHRLGRGRRLVRPGRHQGRGAQPHALLRGRELRPVHAVPQRHREGGRHDGPRRLRRAADERPLPGHDGRLDLRPRPGGAKSAIMPLQILPGGAGMSERITFELNGQSVQAEPGETIWQVAQRQGVEIPHLCYAPEPGYRPDGNCRACMVEIEGERVLAASCIRKPTEGMKVTIRQRAGQEVPGFGLRAALGRPAGARDRPRPPVQVLAVGR